ncbi:hypothetical protein [Mucilaginibacter glaciei]|uniref:Uncharacterized protein n=1 Tax=Mucilaginibacter glaciei TaxID=2772109 RepID=A0A926NLI5_9SPHI|nr:hypothetical protein [Mucilaginibacter glaciei]MBD1394304.1 hypothetical protein [Mucilaginibacter glaciei]
MKKILSTLCVAVIVLFTATSCKKETVVAPNNNLTILTNLSSNSWVTTDNGKTYSAEINVPELDSYANDHAGVLVYLSFTNGVWEQVPEVYNGTSYSFTHNTGKVVLYAQTYNGLQTVARPAAAGVKIVLVDSN